MKTIKIYTIGFTQKTAEAFFGKLIKAGVKKIVDARLNNSSQLAGFAKKDDLRYFLKALGNIDYIHMPILAPSEKLFTDFKKNKGDWPLFEKKFLALMGERRIENVISRTELDRACLLCSEHIPEHCHRRLVAEYLKNKWGNVDIVHLRCALFMNISGQVHTIGLTEKQGAGDRVAAHGIKIMKSRVKGEQAKKSFTSFLRSA